MRDVPLYSRKFKNGVEREWKIKGMRNWEKKFPRGREKKKVREKKTFEKRKKVKEIISDTDGVISSTARLLCQDGCRAII